MSIAPQPTTPHPASQPARSEGLLPADGPDPNLEVAEEVSLDLQSDSTRKVGAMAPDTPVSKPTDAMAEALKPDPASDPAQPLKDAPGNAPPPGVRLGHAGRCSIDNCWRRANTRPAWAELPVQRQQQLTHARPAQGGDLVAPGPAEAVGFGRRAPG